MIPVDGSDYNGSPLVNNAAGVAQTGIPTLRDFNATNLPVVDPNLIPMTIAINDINKAGTLEIFQVGTSAGQVSFWADQKKTPLNPNPIPIPSTNTTWTGTVYIEGTHESAALNDVQVEVAFASTDSTEYASSFTNVTVAPVLNSSTTVIPTPSVSFKNQNPVNGVGGLIAQSAAGAIAGFILISNVTNGPLTMGYVQDVINIQNGANGSAAGVVYTGASGFVNQNLLPTPESKLTWPGLDSYSDNPTNNTTTVTAGPAGSGTVNVNFFDPPSTGMPGDDPAHGQAANFLDIKDSFQIWLVVQYIDANKTIYPIANLTWSANFYATINAPNAGVSQLSPLSVVTATALQSSNANPVQTGGPIALGNISYQ
jgi:hypothetical protein